MSAVGDTFYAKAGHIPTSEAEWREQQAQFRAWRTDARFESYWPIIDRLLALDFADTRRWAVAAEAVRDLQGYDFDAYRQQREYDIKHAGDHVL
jgi:hypothetical protein